MQNFSLVSCQLFNLLIFNLLMTVISIDKPIHHGTKSSLACITKHAKCMTLSVLDTSLPMQQSYDTLALDISALNWCLKASLVNHT